MNYDTEKKLMKLSEVTKLVGVSRKALQEYDKMDLVHPTATTEGGYWLYDEDAVGKISTIQLFSMVGYTRKEIKEFIDTVTGFDHMEERQARYQDAIERLKKKRAQLDSLISMAEAMVACSSPQSKDTLKALYDYKKGGTFSESSTMENLQRSIDYLAELEEPQREQANQLVSVMQPYVVKLMALSLCQGEAPASPSVLEKVEDVFDEWKAPYTILIRTLGNASESESVHDLPLSDQLTAFRDFTETTLGGNEPSAAGDSLEMQINHRYGEGTANKIRKMIDTFIEHKTK
ncbi:MAG: MerR family transcriptional regulator [Lachnospiraceae bacterium]|nr:MerR family transcriptional regulator [Lachnospiraceae bacterium]